MTPDIKAIRERAYIGSPSCATDDRAVLLALVDEMRRYIRHTPTCWFGTGTCDCGLDELLRGTGEGR